MGNAVDVELHSEGACVQREFSLFGLPLDGVVVNGGSKEGRAILFVHYRNSIV